MSQVKRIANLEETVAVLRQYQGMLSIVVDNAGGVLELSDKQVTDYNLSALLDKHSLRVSPTEGWGIRIERVQAEDDVPGYIYLFDEVPDESPEA